MTISEWLRAKAVIQTIATQEGKTPAEIRASMQEAIDEAWNTDDPAARAKQLQLFPDGKKPTVERFMLTLSKYIR